MTTPDAVVSVRSALTGAGWTADGVLALLGPDGWAALSRGETVPAARALRADPEAASSPAGVLTRLFLLHEAVPERALAALPIRELHACGLVSRAGSAWLAALDLRPYGEPDTDWYVVSDLDHRRLLGAPADLRVDHVLGVGGASLTLAGLVPRVGVSRALDVGTGCGIQALHLSRHVDHVVASDPNQRALRLAALGWALSGLDPARVSWREGSLLAPVEGEVFDLVVSNPPFVISPGHQYTYRDAGLHGDELGRILLGQTPAVLAEGGWAVLLANWLHQRGRDWRQRVEAWAEPARAAGCDVWIAQREVTDAAEYASTWLRDAGDDDAPDYAARYDAWLAAFDAEDADAVGMGWVVLRRGGQDDPWLSVEDVRDAVRAPDGAQVVRRFERADEVRGLGAAAALAARYAPGDGMVLERGDLWLGSDDRIPLPARLRRAAESGGWRAPVFLDGLGTEIVMRAAASKESLAEVAAGVAAAAEEDLDDVLALALPLVRTLVDQGVLRPAP